MKKFEKAKKRQWWEIEQGWKWVYRPSRVTDRSYGIPRFENGRLPLFATVRGKTDTDYFHFDCWGTCGLQSLECDVEFLGVREAPDNRPWKHQIVLGLTCRICGRNGVIKISPLANEHFQLRDFSPERISKTPREEWVYPLV